MPAAAAAMNLIVNRTNTQYSLCKLTALSMSRLAKILLVLAVLSGCAWTEYLYDDGLGTSWVHVAVRNWQHVGFFKLHGQIVSNPGGFEATTNPDIYPGMSPVCLYPVFIAAQLFAWTGLGTLSFQILLAAVVFWAIWRLLGRDGFAFLLAAVAVICPGYSRWLNILDPNVITVVLGLPYITIVIATLTRPRIGFIAFAGLLVLTLAFLSLNWTTVWVLGPCSLLLLGLPQISRRAVISFIAVTGASSLLFVVGSVIIKAGHNHAGSGGGLLLFLRGYTWGAIGYGLGLTTVTAFARLAVVNGIGLLPLILLGGWEAKKYFHPVELKSWLAISPFALTLAEIGFMRNYFGHHPWMAGPLLLVGIIFSLVLLRTRDVNPAAITV